MKVKLIDPKTIGIFFQYDARLVTIVKQLIGRQFNDYGKFWHFPVDGLAATNLKILERTAFDIDPKVLEAIKDMETRDKELQLPTTMPLYDFQKQVAQFMVESGSCLNACFVGAGKTLTCLAVCEHLKAKKVLIIVPKSVLLQWAEVEIPKWLPLANVDVISGNKYVRQMQYRSLRQYVVMGYETFRSDVEEISYMEWDVVIADEAHRLASPKTKTYKAMQQIKATHRFALTATPVMNKAEDMFGIINWVKPGALGNYYAFCNRYCVKDQWGSVKFYRNMDELAVRVAPHIIKKTLEEVGLELPAKTETDLPVELSGAETKLYSDIRRELLFEIDKLLINKIQNPVMLQATIVKIGKLFELCDSLELLGENKRSSKLEVLKEHLESTIQNGQKAIVITRFARMAKILTRELAQYSPLLITGATDDRQGVLTQFEVQPARSLLVGTEAIGQGLNLQMANVLYNYDLAWNPARMEQRAGRIHRQGQEKPVFIYNLVVQRSVETWLQRKLEDKKQLSERLLPTTAVGIKEMLE